MKNPFSKKIVSNVTEYINKKRSEEVFLSVGTVDEKRMLDWEHVVNLMLTGPLIPTSSLITITQGGLHADGAARYFYFFERAGIDPWKVLRISHDIDEYHVNVEIFNLTEHVKEVLAVMERYENINAKYCYIGGIVQIRFIGKSISQATLDKILVSLEKNYDEHVAQQNEAVKAAFERFFDHEKLGGGILF